MLFESFPLGPVKLKNRMVAVPIFTGYALPDGRVSSLLIDHYAALAASGVAMVVVANTAVATDGVTSRFNLRADDDRFIPGLTRLARAIKRRGALACLQLNHGGRFARTAQPLLPSPVDRSNLVFNVSSLKDFMNFFPLERRFGLTQEFLRRIRTWNRAMTDQDRERIISSFGQAAVRARQAGFDLVELHGATGYLLNQFLSPLTHRAANGHELPFRERAHFPLAVLREVKNRLPDDFPVGYRLLLHEWVPDGIDLTESMALARLLKENGITYLSVSAGTYHSIFTAQVINKTARPAYLREDARALREILNVPIVMAGRIVKPALAEKLLQEGATDLIGLGRPLRVDPDWVNKAKNGQSVQACVNCNSCLKRVILEKAFICARWPNWVQERTDLEHRLLTRGMYRVLWVATSRRDMEVFRAAMSRLTPSRHGISSTLLFLEPEALDSGFESERNRTIRWAREIWDKRPFCGGVFNIVSRAARPPLDDLILSEVAQGDYGTVLLGRNPDEIWRERLVYRQRQRVLSLVGWHPQPNKVLVALDLSPASLLVMRFIDHALTGETDVQIRFVHMLEGPAETARRRWIELKKILGWNNERNIEFRPTSGRVAMDLLNAIEMDGYGTVVMGKRGLSGIKRWLLGSVSASVYRGLADQTMVLID